MTRFQYRLLRFEQSDFVMSDGESLIQALDRQGDEGWELATLVPEPGRRDRYVAILKRPETE
jgi:hypothetical protein